MNNWEKSKAIRDSTKCPNCFGPLCKGRGYCEEPFHCNTCKDNPRKAPHHKLVCTDLDNPANAEIKKVVMERRAARAAAAAKATAAAPSTSVRVEVKQESDAAGSSGSKRKVRTRLGAPVKKAKVYTAAELDEAEAEMLDHFELGRKEEEQNQENK